MFDSSVNGMGYIFFKFCFISSNSYDSEILRWFWSDSNKHSENTYMIHKVLTYYHSFGQSDVF